MPKIPKMPKVLKINPGHTDFTSQALDEKTTETIDRITGSTGY
jgi:hypothetical protein